MDLKDRRFEMVMSRRHAIALELLSQQGGVSKAEVVRKAIEYMAKTERIWNDLENV